jgi:hypothetical protein
LFIDSNYGDEILVRSAATAKTKDRSQHQKPARTLSFNVEADRYRKDNRRKTLGNSQTENTKVNLRALRQCSYLDKERRYSWPADLNKPVILRKFSRRDFPHPDGPH